MYEEKRKDFHNISLGVFSQKKKIKRRETETKVIVEVAESKVELIKF
jgi:hypothetical protein